MSPLQVIADLKHKYHYTDHKGCTYGLYMIGDADCAGQWLDKENPLHFYEQPFLTVSGARMRMGRTEEHVETMQWITCSRDAECAYAGNTC